MHSDALEHIGTHLAPGNEASARRMEDQNVREPPGGIARCRQYEQALNEENLPTSRLASTLPDSNGNVHSPASSTMLTGFDTRTLEEESILPSAQPAKRRQSDPLQRRCGAKRERTCSKDACDVSLDTWEEDCRTFIWGIGHNPNEILCSAYHGTSVKACNRFPSGYVRGMCKSLFDL